MTKLEKLYLFSVVFTESVMMDSAMVELLGDTRTISKETGSVSTEVQEMVLPPLKSSLAPCWGSVIVMARMDYLLVGQLGPCLSGDGSILLA